MTCETIAKEITKNEEEALRLAGLGKDVEGKNVAVVVGATLLLSPLATLAIDFSKKEQIEFRALQDRNKHLIQLQEKKEC